MTSTHAFICDAVRTPFGRYVGSLSGVRADDLGAVPIRALMARNTRVDWTAVADVIRLKQLVAAANNEISVVVLEKGSEPGAHILSGAIMDPRALSELIPDWKELGAPLNQPVAAAFHQRVDDAVSHLEVVNLGTDGHHLTCRLLSRDEWKRNRIQA